MIDRLVEGMMASVQNSRAEGCRHTFEKHRRWGVDDQWDMVGNKTNWDDDQRCDEHR